MKRSGQTVLPMSEDPVLEEQTKCIEVVEQECDRFLGLYSPDSTVEVSEKALAPIFSALRSYMNVGHAETCDCPVIVNLARRTIPDSPGVEIVVMMDKDMKIVSAIGGFQGNMPLFVSSRPPRVTNFRELSLIGITPYDVVQHLKRFSMAFTVGTTATQAPAHA